MNYERFQHTLNNQKKNIYLVDMTKEIEPYFSQSMRRALDKAIERKQKILIIHNKKGYSTGLLCTKCGHIPQCTNCSVNISYHQTRHDDMIGLCHICKRQYNIPTHCPDCHSDQIKMYGIGIQQLARQMQEEYYITPLIIDNEQINSPNKIQKTQAQLAKNNIVIATSILSQPSIQYKPDIIIITQADIGLNIPDYTAQHKNFLFLYEIFTKYDCPNFIVQSFNVEHNSIRLACKLDPVTYQDHEDSYRKEYHYPPYSELCIILYKHETEQRLHNQIDKLYKELLYLKEKYQIDYLEIYTTPPLVYKMFGKYRYNIICKGTNLKSFMDIVYTKLKLSSKGFKIDRNAESIV